MQVDPFSAEFRRDPYPVYRLLREADPVHRGANGAWIITRYADARAALNDSRLVHWTGGDAGATQFHRIVSRWVRLMDPRNTTHLRALVVKTMSPAVLEKLRPDVERTLDECLEGLKQVGKMDVVADLAEPLALSINSRMLGVPQDERSYFRQLARKLMSSIFEVVDGRTGNGPDDPLQSFCAYVLQLVERKRSELGNDLISALLVAQSKGDDITADDYLAFFTIFLFAGHENMMNSISSGILALIRHPEQWRLLRDRPELLRNAVEELLRYDSPVQFVALVAREQLELGEQTINPGESLLVSIGSANRDPAQFHEPEELDISRDPNPHLTFGAGALYCIGAALARLEGGMAIDAMVRRFEPLQVLGDSLQWRSSPPILRGLASLSVALTPGR
jgi:pimeloyl-[acyl-carrier protein] synthase